MLPMPWLPCFCLFEGDLLFSSGDYYIVSKALLLGRKERHKIKIKLFFLAQVVYIWPYCFFLQTSETLQISTSWGSSLRNKDPSNIIKPVLHSVPRVTIYEYFVVRVAPRISDMSISLFIKNGTLRMQFVSNDLGGGDASRFIPIT